MITACMKTFDISNRVALDHCHGRRNVVKVEVDERKSKDDVQGLYVLFYMNTVS